MLYFNIFLLFIPAYLVASIFEFIIYLIFPSFYTTYIQNDYVDYTKYRNKIIIFLLITVGIYFFSMLIWDKITTTFYSDIIWHHSDRVISTLLFSITFLLGSFAFHMRNNIDMSDASNLFA